MSIGGNGARARSPGGRPWQAVATGGSAGGVEALEAILARLPEDYPLPVFVVQHLHATDAGFLAGYLDERCLLPVRDAGDKEAILPGHVYVAPANYHLLVERDQTLALIVDEKVNWSRPSIDVFFESAARVWGRGLASVVLSGSNHDGAAGARWVQERGGRVLVQDPACAQQPAMPVAALEAVGLGLGAGLSLEAIADTLLELGGLAPASPVDSRGRMEGRDRE